LKEKSSQRALRWGALLLLMALPGLPTHAHARAHHTDAWARDHFATAERMREALNGRPPADRTRHDYQRVINAYRNVYFGAPTSAKADPSVVAVAETLVEMGRRFDDDKILNEAVAQYKFLRREYPGSKYRCDALFTIGEIYKDDLNDPERARGVFQEFLHRYPHNRLVEDAQQAVAELDRQAAAEKKAEGQKRLGQNQTGKNSAGKDSDAHGDGKADSKTAAGVADSSERHSGRLPRVTGIRHWSTPDYTRVAIDLESEIKFGSQRIAHPDRIFFDLRETKLASTLLGKSFDVDDGFLKKIRVAEFQPGRTRVVLEVDDLSDYEAFLLPNPYRLIIDIHGKDMNGKDGKMARARELKEADTATADVEAPPKAGTKADVPKNVPKSELRADMKALAGKTASTREEIHGENIHQNIASKDAPESAKLHPSPGPEKRAAADDKNVPSTVRKVVVEADDDDEDAAPPAKVAKLEAPAAHSRSSSATSAASSSASASATTAAFVKSDHAADTDSDSASGLGEKSASDAATPSPVREKSAPRLTSRLASNRAADLGAREAKPTARGDRSLIRALGLKIGRIVIDPGHGGHDTGTIGPNGLEEKDLVLEVGRRLGKLLETRLGAEVVYTRKDDTFIPLETRTAIANQQRADLFISIHANSSHDAAARGVETYYLNFTSSPEALEVAARENAVSEKSIYELQDLVKKIALKEKIEESREFAGDVQESLHSGLAAKSPAIRNRGVKKAPFIVLIGANMPSILAEISFVSNPADEHRLETSEYRQRIAESLYRGIAKYVDGLSGVKVASKMDKAAGQ
jgi:N-acetylmuramoyl-L-alanine amidase